jgi:hypothetical protein
MRYVHPSESAVSKAMSSLSGHNFGHHAENAKLLEAGESPVSVDAEGVDWRALGRRFQNFLLNPGETISELQLI